MTENNKNNDIMIVDEIFPKVLPLIILKDRPVFPRIMHPVLITGQKQIDLIHKLVDLDTPHVGLVLFTGDDTQVDNSDDVKLNDIAPVGVVGRMLKVTELKDGVLQVLFEMKERFEIQEFVTDIQPYRARVRYWRESKEPADEETKAYSVALINTIRELIKNNPLFKEELNLLIGKRGVEEPSVLADFSALMTTANKEELQDLLQTRDLKWRLEKALGLMKKELEVTKTTQKINKRIEDKLTGQQREFFLKAQLKEIQKELGLKKDERESLEEKIRERMKEIKLSKEALERVEDELEKLSVLEPSSPEYHVTHNYLETITSLPWGITTKDNLDLTHAKEVLDRDHFGMDDVKDRILEHISVGKMKGGLRGTILLLVGPPGVGKTSIGHSIAKSLGREFFRFALGGMRDEAEIKGHRRTYIGAMPGKLINAIRSAKTQNPVILLDEIDKIGKNYQGDPASALLEVLDPEQNKDFLDHFLDVRFDLSEVLFICTANTLDTIPDPLRDRMEVIPLSGYITQEKIQIAKNYLIPKLIKKDGLEGQKVEISEEVIEEIIENYARESGVRNLEKQLQKILRKQTKKMLLEDLDHFPETKKEDLRDLLGRPVFKNEDIYPAPVVGVITGLAYTSFGGDVLSIEAQGVRANKGGLKQTGKLGDVMVESSEIAYSYIRSLLSVDREASDYLKHNFIHLHVPAGATPKDGPSAGITMACALYSLATNKAPRENVAMTGELTIKGRVLPIGGVREKVLAAKRAGVTNIIFPKANEEDYDDLPDYLREGMNPYFVGDFDEVKRICFE